MRFCLPRAFSAPRRAGAAPPVPPSTSSSAAATAALVPGEGNLKPRAARPLRHIEEVAIKRRHGLHRPVVVLELDEAEHARRRVAQAERDEAGERSEQVVDLGATAHTLRRAQHRPSDRGFGAGVCGGGCQDTQTDQPGTLGHSDIRIDPTWGKAKAWGRKRRWGVGPTSRSVASEGTPST